MNEYMHYLCDNANLEAIKKISAIQLPIKEMIIYLETKIEEYDNVLNNDTDNIVYFLKNKSMECVLYLKKIQ
jgi:glycine cleavage system H lipoate-binding protein